MPKLDRFFGFLINSIYIQKLSYYNTASFLNLVVMIGQKLAAYFVYLIFFRKKYLLFIDVNHVCYYKHKSNEIRKREFFLMDEDNFHNWIRQLILSLLQLRL